MQYLKTADLNGEALRAVNAHDRLEADLPCQIAAQVCRETRRLLAPPPVAHRPTQDSNKACRPKSDSRTLRSKLARDSFVWVFSTRLRAHQIKVFEHVFSLCINNIFLLYCHILYYYCKRFMKNETNKTYKTSLDNNKREVAGSNAAGRGQKGVFIYNVGLLFSIYLNNLNVKVIIRAEFFCDKVSSANECSRADHISNIK